MIQRIRFTFLITIIAMLSIGCSSGLDTPISPIPEQYDPVLDIPVDASLLEYTQRDLLGQYRMDIDFDNNDVFVHPLRDLAGHLRVDQFIPPPHVTIINADPLTGIIDVDVTIANPLQIDAYDIRLIIYTDDYGIRLRNADNWTNLWDIPGGMPINPFKAYAKNEPNRVFAGHSEHTERLQLFIPGPPNITFAIDASYPSNCEEPYLINNFSQTTLYDKGGEPAILEVDVYDWQDNANQVQLYCPAITETPFSDFMQIGADKWRLEMTNSNSVSEGNYFAVVVASSENTNDKLYHPVSIRVDKKTIPKWTILAYITECNLGDRIQGDINEMEVVGSVEGVMDVIVCWDKDQTGDDVILKIEKDPEGYNDTIISTVLDCGGEVIPPGGLPHAKRGPVENFLRWGIREFPAEKYAFLLYGHGNGPFRGIIEQDDFLVVAGGLQVWEVRDLIQTVVDEYPEIDKLDIFNLVTCLGSWIEVAYVLKDVAHNVVASEWLQWACDFEWAELMAYMVDNIDTLDRNHLASEFVWNYLRNTPNPATLCAWESAKLDTDVIPALNNFSQELIDAIPTHNSHIVTCRNDNGRWGAWCNDSRVKDLGLFADHISQRDVPQSLIDASIQMRDSIADSMLAIGNNPNGAGMCPDHATGWQIWFPSNYLDVGNNRRRQDYVSIGFDNTLWGDFLAEFHLANLPTMTHSNNKSANNTGKYYKYRDFSVDAENISWGIGRWFFQEDVGTDEMMRVFIDPDSSEFEDFRQYYPNAHTVQKIVYSDDTIYIPRYFDDTDSGFQCDLGYETLSGGADYGIRYDSDLCLPMPFVYEYSETASAGSSNNPDYSISYNVDIIGYGYVTTQLATYSTILVRTLITEYDSGSPTQQSVNYTWIDNSGRYIATVTTHDFDQATLVPDGTVTIYQLYERN